MTFFHTTFFILLSVYLHFKCAPSQFSLLKPVIYHPLHPCFYEGAFPPTHLLLPHSPDILLCRGIDRSTSFHSPNIPVRFKLLYEFSKNFKITEWLVSQHTRLTSHWGYTQGTYCLVMKCLLHLGRVMLVDWGSSMGTACSLLLHLSFPRTVDINESEMSRLRTREHPSTDQNPSHPLHPLHTYTYPSSCALRVFSVPQSALLCRPEKSARLIYYRVKWCAEIF